MIPIIFKIPGLGWEVPGYGLALMIGFLASIMWAAHRATKSGGNPDTVLNCGFIALIGGVVGARFMYVVHYWDQFAGRGNTLQVIFGILDVRKGGLEVYGGFICVVTGVLLYLWWGKHSIRWYLDIVAPSTALGMAIGRIGCFLNGCCWGGVCEQVPWAVRFPYGSPAQVQQWQDRTPGAGVPAELLYTGDATAAANVTALPRESLRISDHDLDAARRAYDDTAAQNRALKSTLERTTDATERRRLDAELDALQKQFSRKYDQPTLLAVRVMSLHNLSAAQLKAVAHEHASLPVHPTQLYSTITLGLLALLLNALYWRRTRDGQVICTLLLIEPWTRWVLELMRADNPVDTLGKFTISQFLAICLSVLGLIGLLVLQKLPPRSPRAILWEPPPEEAAPKRKAKDASPA